MLRSRKKITENLITLYDMILELEKENAYIKRILYLDGVIIIEKGYNLEAKHRFKK